MTSPDPPRSFLRRPPSTIRTPLHAVDAFVALIHCHHTALSAYQAYAREPTTDAGKRALEMYHSFADTAELWEAAIAGYLNRAADIDPPLPSLID